MEPIKDYKIAKHNSTVCGYPGRDFDWSKFDWDEKTFNDDLRRKAPAAIADNFLIAPNCEYLHVPYEWKEAGTIYRVRPNYSMYAGEVYRGRLVKSVKAIKKVDGWYWRLEFNESA